MADIVDTLEAAVVADGAQKAAVEALRKMLLAEARVKLVEDAINASKTSLTAMLQAVGVNHRWTGTVLELRLPDGTWGAAVDLRGPEGQVGPPPLFSVGTVVSGSSPSVVINPVPGQPRQFIVDFVLQQGAAGPPGPSGSGTGDVLGPSSSDIGELVTFGSTDGKTISRGGVVVSAYIKTLLDEANQAAFWSAIGLTTALAAKEDILNKGTANGYAPLGSDNKIPTIHLPASVIGAVSYQGTWDASLNSPTIPAASSTNKGYYYKVTVAGSTNVDGQTDWKIGDWIISNGTTWDKVDNSEAVTSVAGLVGAISSSALKTALELVKADVGLSNVDNTSDAGKPVSIAQQAALDAKADETIMIGGSGLVTGGGDLTVNRTLTVTKASQAEAEAGTADDRAMTPLRTKQSIDKFARVLNTTAISANTTLTAAHNGLLIAASNTITLSLTAAATLGDGWNTWVYNDGSGIVTIDPNAAETINGRATTRLYPGESAQIYCNGTNFRLLGRRGGPVLLTSTTIGSAVSSVDFETGFDDTEFREFLLEAFGLSHANGTATNIVFRFKKSGAYQASGYATEDGINTTGLAIGATTFSNTTLASARLTITNPFAAGAYQQVAHLVAALENGDSPRTDAAAQSTAAALEGLRVISLAGNLDAGTLKFYGIRG